jgi:hypothetical protein
VDESAAHEHAGGHAAVEKVVCAERGDDLQQEENDGEANAFADRRCLDGWFREAMRGVGLGCEFDDRLKKGSARKRGGIMTYFTHPNNQRTGDLCDVTCHFHNPSRPEPPLDAIVHGPKQTRPLPPMLLPPLLLACCPVPAQRPPNGPQPGFDVAARKTRVVLFGFFTPSFERSEDALGDETGGLVILKSVEICRLKRPGKPEREKRGEPAKGEDAEPRRGSLGY